MQLYVTRGAQRIWQRSLRWRVQREVVFICLSPLWSLFSGRRSLSGTLNIFPSFPAHARAISYFRLIRFSHLSFLAGPDGGRVRATRFCACRSCNCTEHAFFSQCHYRHLLGSLAYPGLDIGRDVVSIIAFLLLAFILSFLFTFLFNKSKGSLIPVLLFHAAQNAEEIFEALFPAYWYRNRLGIDVHLRCFLLAH